MSKTGRWVTQRGSGGPRPGRCIARRFRVLAHDSSGLKSWRWRRIHFPVRCGYQCRRMFWRAEAGLCVDMWPHLGWRHDWKQYSTAPPGHTRDRIYHLQEGSSIICVCGVSCSFTAHSLLNARKKQLHARLCQEVTSMMV